MAPIETAAPRRRANDAPKELRTFLAAFGPEISRLFLEAREQVLTAAPDATELIYDAYNAVTVAFSFSGRLKEAFCHVAAYSAHVNVGFNRGADLADPDGLLVGSGARIRHLRVERPGDLRSPALQGLIRGAVAQGRALVPARPAAPASLVRPTTGAKRRPRTPSS
jgi:hypothetical protein